MPQGYLPIIKVLCTHYMCTVYTSVIKVISEVSLAVREAIFPLKVWQDLSIVFHVLKW